MEQNAQVVHIDDYLFLLSIPKQHLKSLSAPSLDCLCQAEAMSWSGISIQVQDYDPKISVFEIPGSFIEVPRSLHLLFKKKKNIPLHKFFNCFNVSLRYSCPCCDQQPVVAKSPEQFSMAYQLSQYCHGRNPLEPAETLNIFFISGPFPVAKNCCLLNMSFHCTLRIRDGYY